MSPMKCLFVLLVPAIGLMACAGNPGPQLTLEQKLAERNYQLGEPVERILQYRLDGWTYLDREHVIMQTEPSTYYLISLRKPCHDLMTAETIAFTTTTNQLTRYDKLLVKGSGSMVDHCYIDALHKLKKTGKKLAAHR